MRLSLQPTCILLILVCASAAVAQWKDPDQPYRDSLKGLSRLVLKVDYGFMDALPDDPREREIGDLIEKRLVDSGIKVAIKQNWEEDSANEPVLRLNIFFMNFDIFYHQASITLELTQETSLARNPALKLRTRTWFSGGGSFGTPSIRNEILAVVDRFICDFKQVNPDIKAPSPKCPSEDAMNRREANTGPRPSVMTKIEDQLIRAAVFGEVKEAKALIAKGADVNAHDFNDATPLWYAVRSGNRKMGETSVIELLLENGANPNITVSCRLTPLMYAVNRGDAKVVKLLLDHGADVNGVTGEGYTALMAAAALGAPEIVLMLLNNGAAVASRARDGRTALTFALSNRDRIASFDRPTFDYPYIDIPEAELLKRAEVKHDKVVQLLKDAGAKD